MNNEEISKNGINNEGMSNDYKKNDSEKWFWKLIQQARN